MTPQSLANANNNFMKYVCFIGFFSLLKGAQEQNYQIH